MEQNKPNLEIQKVLSLALPICATGIINMLGNFIGMKMVAHLGKEQLAAGALAVPTFLTILTIFVTTFYSVGLLISHKKGQGKDFSEIGLIVKNGFYLALLLSIPAVLILWNMDKVFLAIRQNPQIVNHTKMYCHFTAIAMIPTLINNVIAQFFNSTGRPRFNLVVYFFSLPLTILFAYCFVLGHFGQPEMGLGGIAVAFLLVQIIILIVALSYLFIKDKYPTHSYQIFTKPYNLNRFIIKSIFKLGFPIGLQYGGELAALTCSFYLLGYFGTNVLAASQIVSQYNMLVVVFIMGISQAHSLLISEAFGQINSALIKTVLKSSFVILAISCACVSVIFIGFPNQLIQLYIPSQHVDANLKYLTMVFFGLSAIFLFIDGARNLLSSTLRGLHESKTPMRIGIISMWFISLPVSYLFGFTFHGGPIALRIGFISGFILAVVVLFKKVNLKLSDISEKTNTRSFYEKI